MKNAFALLVGVFLCLLLVEKAGAAVLFQDDFNTTKWTQDTVFGARAYCTQATPFVGGWASIAGSNGTFDGVTKNSVEITSPGRLGADDRSFKEWFHPLFTSQWYDYGLMSVFMYTSGPQCVGAMNAQDAYFRWTMKIPTDFDLTSSEGMSYIKMWRTQFTNGHEVYVNFNGTTVPTTASLRSHGNMQIASTINGDTKLTCASFASLADGKWHTIEVHLRGGTNPIKECWVDGGPNKDYSVPSAASVPIGWPTTLGFDRAQLGTGNSSIRDKGPVMTPNNWTAWEYDDYVVADTGPIGFAAIASVDTTNPSCSAFSFATNPATTLNISLSATCTDNVAVTQYYLSESPNAPGSTGWLPYPPTSFTVGGLGLRRGYLTVRDAADNRSATISATVQVNEEPSGQVSGAVKMGISGKTNVSPAGTGKLRFQ